MSEVWRTCREVQVKCGGCGKMDSCTVSPDLMVYKCWRNGGQLVRHWDLVCKATGGSIDERGVTMSMKTHTTLADAAQAYAKLGTHSGTWQYQNAQGLSMMAVLRFDGVEGKQYRPLHLVDGQWQLGDPQAPLPLYRLPDLASATRVYVCEGEKAAEAGRKINLLCTTSAHGAAAPLKSDWTILQDKEVIILPDHDTPGMSYAQTVAKTLLSLKKPARVKIVELPGLKEGDDLFDWCGYMKDHGWENMHNYVEEYARHADWLTLEQLPQALSAPSPASEGEAGPLITSLHEVKPEPIRWLWPGKLALGKLSGWAGAPGDGKSIASMDVAARVTVGGDWPDGGKATAGSVLLITAEDGLADTIRPRLDAAGADVSKVKHFSFVQRFVRGRMVQELFTLSQIRELEKTLEQIGDCRLLIIDPVGSFFGTEVDSNGDASVRSVLAPIAALAERHNLAVLLVMHTRKESSERADDQVMGSRAFTGIVRSMWHIRRDDGDHERRLFLPGKNNAAKALTGLAYRVVDQDGVAKVQWDAQAVDMTADDAVRKSKASSGEGESPEVKLREEIQQWLERQLANGPRQAGTDNNKESQPGTIIQEARASGYSWRSVQRAAAAMGVMRARQGAVTVWLLPSLDA